MAKTGFWLRGATGKLAGAALQKGTGGETVIREIVRPSDPRTQAQLIQRIVMATVGRAYSAMKEICDHSFEGRQKGMETMSAFHHYNAALLRDKVAQAVGGEDGLFTYAFTPLGSALFVVNEYQLSRGSLPAVAVTTGGADDASGAAYMALADNTYQGVLDHYGLQRGDQLTFVWVNANSSGRGHTFAFARVILDPRQADGTEAPLSTTLVSDGSVNLPSPRNEGSFLSLVFNQQTGVAFRLGTNLAGAGIIVSRQTQDGNWRRSDCRLAVRNIENGYMLSECLDMAATSSFSAESDRYLNNAGTSAYVGSGSAQTSEPAGGGNLPPVTGGD